MLVWTTSFFSDNYKINPPNPFCQLGAKKNRRTLHISSIPVCMVPKM